MADYQELSEQYKQASQDYTSKRAHAEALAALVSAQRKVGASKRVLRIAEQAAEAAQAEAEAAWQRRCAIVAAEKAERIAFWLQEMQSADNTPEFKARIAAHIARLSEPD